MHRLIYAGAKGMVMCRCSLSMSSAVLVMNLLKISLKDNKAEKKKMLCYTQGLPWASVPILHAKLPTT